MGRPFAPTLVTNFTEFERTFGGLVRRSGTQRDMPLAVQQFFLNGGVRAYIVRTIDPDETKSATATINITKGFDIDAKGLGAWGNDTIVRIQQNRAFPDRADFYILRNIPNQDPGQVELFSGLGFDPDGDKFYASIINRDSNYIEIQRPAAGFWDGGVAALKLKPPAEKGSTDPNATEYPLAGGNDGDPLLAISLASIQAALTSIKRNDEISILAVPGVTEPTIMTEVLGEVDLRKSMILVMDGVGDQHNDTEMSTYDDVQKQLADISNKTSYAALYWPWLEVPDPYTSVTGATRYAPPSGFIAGLFARTDNSRGVWKAPAGTGGALSGAVGLAVNISDAEQDMLNPVGINAIRQFEASGIVCWGTRTLSVSSNPEYMYVPIRRTAIFLRKSLYRGTQWVVFEPNDAPLWASITFNIDAFMSIQFRSGMFQGGSPKDAYFVLCDASNNYQATIDAGQVHVRVGFAPLKPAEFVIIELQQIRKDS